MSQTIAVLDFGSQYTQVIARRVRDLRVYSKIFPYATTARELKREGVQGIILSGGPASVLAKDAPLPDRSLFDLGIPILGICYGLQLIGSKLGGKVEQSLQREYGRGSLCISKKGSILCGIQDGIRVWNSHGDKLIEMPDGFQVFAETENSKYAVIGNEEKRIYGLQFHPEVSHTDDGSEILKNFLFSICNCVGDWTMAGFIESSVEKIRETVGQEYVILGLSGGVDSSVAAVLIHQAIGNQLRCVFIDNGLLRQNERAEVEKLFRESFEFDLRTVRAEQKFLNRLEGVTDPERKRKIIGKTFVEVFESQLKSMRGVTFLAQGTLYPDVIESVPIGGNPASLIKSHHNVGGLPKNMKLRLLEPLRQLFKDEVRQLGRELGLSAMVLDRHPFPGPGLAIRVIGEITEGRLEILRNADSILLEEIRKEGFYEKVWQAFAVFLPVRTVGVMGDERTYENVIALRVVESLDAMTVDWVRLPYDLLQKISTRIINEVPGVNRVCLDISSKPPSTIEWE
ncbi:MAG: GMP synthase [glutamine-hydrolyzing] [Candidatus Moanabacter tarae]|uniref:GMP synthase [glutamine-hydrolyzing] n=1 Tax=Candidatus Moanibacter tarae TaxID=2200854 RepID=A0A2Z4AHA9_9BACT|nr:MAG: GMP synthase [glutamine-hydrolyzing] [Candidatus Moanabacter tarae]|tara:strand:+ start:20205 stop:21743 length:1539 start_codon:yes stop_codon:yes gene_type:complete